MANRNRDQPLTSENSQNDCVWEVKKKRTQPTTPRFHAASLALRRNVSVDEVGLVSGSLESRSRQVWRWEEEADGEKKRT
jgi:hypothetical protein